MDERMKIDGEAFVSAMMNDDTDSLTHWGKKGMKWGVRRYQNEDGSLTELGKKRYARDQKENSGKKKGDKVGAADPDRWVREDMSRTKKIADESSTMANKLKNQVDNSIRREPKQKMDLSKMTDQQMRNEINRAILERQYNDMFAPQKSTKGREYASQVLDVAGSVLAIGSSALAIALAVKELRG